VTEAVPERAFPKVDALFDGEPPLPPLDPTPRLRRLTALLVVAIPLDLLGITCFTGVPGAFLTLVAYLQADAEQALVDAGRYPSERQAVRLKRIRQLALWMMVFTLVSLALQVFLFATTDFYTGTLLPLVERLLM
jgi:hypothetical protein